MTDSTASIPTTPTEDGLYANVTTNRGDILIQLHFQQTPLTVMNFVGLAEGKLKTSGAGAPQGTPYYDGLIFHRVLPDFMIQGGDPTGTGTSGPGYQFKDEINRFLSHNRPGILSMANAGPGTNGSQFFITHKATPWLDGKHTVFGCVITGQDVVDSIEQGDSIKKMTILRVGDEANAFQVTQEQFDEEKSDSAAAKKLYPNAKTTASGLMYEITKEGKGKTPKAGNRVEVHYVGTLLDGKKFDASRDHGNAFAFPVGKGQVIEGWDEGIMLMKAGEHRTLIIPPNLGYGAQGAGGVIPANAWLVFKVEMVSFKS